MSIVKNGRKILSNVIDTQISIHEKFGGVVPEIASRNHVEAISTVMKKAVADANININDIDAIACTYGPGLVGALLVGVSYAKALSYALNKPLIAVNHIKGHIAANYITHEKLEPPFLCMMMSGGNTQIILVKDYNTFEVLGKTKDDAIGEAFDKVARVIGVGYPGGPVIDKMATIGEHEYNLPIPLNDETYNFSFSGLKSAVINLVHNKAQRGEEVNKENLSKSFQDVVVDIITRKTMKALKEKNVNYLIVAGGVAANKGIRNKLEELCKKENIECHCPDFKYCTDNATMIGAAAFVAYKKGIKSDTKLNAKPGETLV
mgnify:CR=1 FL=1